MTVDPIPELSGPSEHGPAVAPLRGLLELSRLMRRQPSLSEVLDAVARTVSQVLGFATVAINTYHPETDEYEVAIVRGSARARRLLLGEITPASAWDTLLDPQFLHHGVYFIPEGTMAYDDPEVTWYRPEGPLAAVAGDDGDDDDRWRVDDALFAPLDGWGGRLYGVISVDEPETGRRPDDQAMEVLGALAVHAALAIESASQLHELESALARNRAVIASTLDCVVAIDSSGRIIEFNPAAERTFGHRSAEALGQDVVDLLVPPENRDEHRSYIRRVLAPGDSRLLGRRVETAALCADGSRLPVELTMALVRSGDDDAPVFYGFLRDITERRRGEEQLAYLAYHDPLTGLPNRALVEEQLDLALARARRSGGSAALMFVDLDDFKEVNDRLGHAAGDQLLAAVSARLRAVLRDSDMLARHGGDEFLVVLADLTGDPTPAAENVGGKLIDALREPFVVAGTEVRTGTSIGISLYPDDAADTETLLRHADVAMYRAKTAGGGRLAFHERSAALSTRRASISTQLRRAIVSGELELHYQPVWSLSPKRTISGVEALLRWRHPDRGLLTPDAFLILAEQGNAGDELIDWVLREACRQVRWWRDDGLLPVTGLNVSPHQLLAPRFVSRIVRHITDDGLLTGNFVIELTESAWSVDSAEALEVISRLRAAGMWLALDNFGVGYTSLSRLSDLDCDIIKVDRRMLVDVPGNATAVNVLRAVFGLAEACGAELIAEGVETDAQIAFLIEYGVTRAQGFHLGHPMPGPDLTPLLKRFLVPEAPPRRARSNGAGRS